MIENISIFTAFGAGLATFLAPCTFVTLPVFITYLIGSTSEELNKGGQKVRLKSLLITLSYSAGFTVVFVALGFAASTISSIFISYGEIINKVVGALLVFFGLFMLFGERIKALRFLYKSRAQGKGAENNYVFLRAFLIGFTSAFAWSSCVGPILGSILLYAGATTSHAWEGGFLLFVYSMGIAFPLLVFTYLMGVGIQVSKRVKVLVASLYKFSAILLIILGILMLTGFYAYLVSWIASFFGPIK